MAQIAGVLAAANAAEIAAARLALERATEPVVLNFADQMQADHLTAERLQSELLGSFGQTSEESASSRQITATSTNTLVALENQPASTFDAAYVQAEIAGLGIVTGLLDRALGDQEAVGFVAFASATRWLVMGYWVQARLINDWLIKR
jgi:putative membrane protein